MKIITKRIFFSVQFVLIIVLFLLYNNEKKFTAVNGEIIQDVQVKFVTVGHLYSLLKYPKKLDELANRLNSEKFDALIFTGDLTYNGSIDEWNIVEKFINRINIQVFYTAGNHDLRDEQARMNWAAKVGYFSSKVEVKGVNFYLLNSTNALKANYNWEKIVSGNGIDSTGIHLLRTLDTGQVNFVFMHHTLYSYDLWRVDHEKPNSHDANAELQEESWNKDIRPLLKDKVRQVYAGDWHSRRTSITLREGVVLIANGLAKIESEKNETPTYIATYVLKDGTIINRVLPL